MRALTLAGNLARKHRHGIATLTFIVVVTIVFFPVWAWRAGVERRALERMRIDERRALYHQTLEQTQAVCRQAESEPDLAVRCEELADFLEHFPECDTECRSFVHGVRRGPSR